MLIPFGDGYHRAIIWDRQRDNIPVDVPVTLEEIRDAARRIAGSDFGMHDPRWKSRFLSEQRQAAHYRFGRCCWRATPRTPTRRSARRA